MSSSGFL